MADWEFDVPTSGSKVLPFAARAWQALSSQGYAFEESVADLVDNSVDARPTEVIVHFLRDGDQLVSLIIVDDGHGMDEDELDTAMTVGGQTSYRADTLGMFGTGLKSASLSQASSVTVVSRKDRAGGAGRRWVKAHAESDHRCDIVDPGYAHALLDRYQDRPITSHGTIVRWDDVKDFPQDNDGKQTDRYQDRIIATLNRHLGLYLHRLLARKKFTLSIQVEDVRTGMVYRDDVVDPLDPFAYPVSGSPGYPKTFIVDLQGIGELPVTAHIWTPKSNLPQYKAIGSVTERQGFYMYRNDRLVQAGGWNGLRQSEGHFALARISVDLPPARNDHFHVTVKKSGVETTSEFSGAVKKAVSDDGTTFDEYLRAAETAYREARKHGPATRDKSVPAGSGIAAAISKVLESELDFTPGAVPIAFRWIEFEDAGFFEYDREENTVWLNIKYRKAISGEERGRAADAPMVKALMYLLFYGGGLLTGERFGPKAKDNLALWDAVLAAAAEVELKRWQSYE